MQNQRNERPNNRPDIRNNEVPRPQPQYQPQVQNRGIQQREMPQMENKSEQGSRGNGQQINHGGGRWHN